MKSSAIAMALAALVGAGAHAQPSAGSAHHPTSLPAGRSIGHIEPVAQFHHAMPTGVTVSAKGRIFVNYPRWGDDVPFTVAEIRGGVTVAFPDAAMNTYDAKHPSATLISVQSVVVDPRDRLWILDTAAPGFSEPKAGGAKLVAIDLSTDTVVKTIVLGENVVLKTTYLNDVRFDLRQGRDGVAYITDSSLAGPGGIIVVDLATGDAWRRLDGHPSTAADPNFVPVVEGERIAVREKGKAPAPLAVASDGIAISADGGTLYYCPLSSRRLYAVPTKLLLDRDASKEAQAAAVVDLGEKGASDGLETDDKGRIYTSDYEHNAIRQREPDGAWKTIAHDPRMLWPDTLSVGPDGYLYFTTNQLHRQALFHDGKDERAKPYTLFRVKIDAGPVQLK